MIRRELIKRKPAANPTDFRMRGGDVSRLEGFSDNVFGFALTLLVVSLEVPKSFGDLMGTMRGFVGFAVCFALLAIIWHDHYQFFRRYGLEDGYTVVLNLILLFLVMFYVYPLKFLFTLLVQVFTGLGPPGGKIAMGSGSWPSLMIIYGIGFVAMYAVFALLYMNAYRQRDNLDLNELERYDTRSSIGSNFVLVGVGLLSIILAAKNQIALSGMMYWLIGISMSMYWTIAGKRRRPLEERLLASIAAPGDLETSAAVAAPPVY